MPTTTPNPNEFDYLRRGESIRFLRGKAASGEFDYFKRGEPFLEIDIFTAGPFVYTDSNIISSKSIISTSEIAQYVESTTITSVSSPQVTYLGDGVISGLAVSGAGSSGPSDIPPNAPKFSITTGVARLHGVQSLPGQIPNNTCILESAPDLTYDRIDLAVAQQASSAPFGPQPNWDTRVEAGTAAPIPVVPPTPSDCVLLATIYVPANSTNSSQCTITDMRQSPPVLPSETAQFVESTTISSTTTPSSLEEHYTYDSATIPSSTSVTSIDTTDYSDSSTVNGVTNPSTQDIAAFVESREIDSFTSLSATELLGATDAGTASTTTGISQPSDIYNAVDSATVPGTTNVSTTTEEHDIPDSSTISGTTLILSTDTTQYIDGINSTINSITDVSAIEQAGGDTFDANTIQFDTNVSLIEQYGHSDSSTVIGITTIFSTDTKGTDDSNTITGQSYVIISDTSQYTEIATVISRTTLIGLEIQFIVELVGIGIKKWDIVDSTKHFSAQAVERYAYATS